MSRCVKPRIAWLSLRPSRSGDFYPVYSADQGQPGSVHVRDCGDWRSCVGCASMRAEDFSGRCHHESLFHELNAVLTLTYESEPGSVDLAMREHQLFHKRLRARGMAHRYADVIERGSRFGRLHGHSIVFGQDFRDDSYGGYERDGKQYYCSAAVTECWPHGIAQVMPATARTIFYAAGDAMKNFERESHLLWSKKPFLGAEFVKQFGQDLLKGFWVLDGVKHRVPASYLRREEFAELFAPLKAARGFFAESIDSEEVSRSILSAESRELNLRATLDRRRGEF